MVKQPSQGKIPPRIKMFFLILYLMFSSLTSFIEVVRTMPELKVKSYKNVFIVLSSLCRCIVLLGTGGFPRFY